VALFGSKTLKNFFEIASILDIATNSGMISEMNYNVVKEVITELADIISTNFDITNIKSSLLNPEFFSVKDIFLNEEDQGQKIIKDIYQGQYYKRQNVLYNKEKLQTIDSKQSIGGEKGTISRLSPKGENRRVIILNLLENKPNINIGDVSGVITDCSEKTIQRDLSNLPRSLAKLFERLLVC